MKDSREIRLESSKYKQHHSRDDTANQQTLFDGGCCHVWD